MIVPYCCFAEDPPTLPEPYPCSGYNPSQGNWNTVGVFPLQELEANCAPGYAYLSVDFPVGTPRAGGKIALAGRCCRLPDGVLTNIHTYALEVCPGDTVATGTRAERQVHPCMNNWGACVKEWETIDQYFRCTGIDTKRYRIGPKQPGYILGFNHSLTMQSVTGVGFTTRSRIPLALRYGVVRDGRFGLDSGGFVGFPWGSLLVGKKSKKEILFAELQYRGANGDPADGTPVRIYPDCAGLTNPLDPYPRCEPSGRTAADEFPKSHMSDELALRKHQLRVLQLNYGTLLAIMTHLQDATATIHPVLAYDPKAWKVSTLPEIQATLLANIVVPIEATNSQICKMIVDATGVAACPDGSGSESIRTLVALLTEKIQALSSVASTAEALREVQSLTETFALQISAFQREQHLQQFDILGVIPLSPDEVAPLRTAGTIGSATIPEIDARSAVIVAAIDSLRRGKVENSRTTP